MYPSSPSHPCLALLCDAISRATRRSRPPSLGRAGDSSSKSAAIPPARGVGLVTPRCACRAVDTPVRAARRRRTLRWTPPSGARAAAARMIIMMLPVSVVRVAVPVSAFVAPSGVQPATRRRVRRSLGLVVGIVVEVARDGRALGDTQRRVLLLVHLERGGLRSNLLRLARRVGARPGPWAGVSLGGVTAEEVGVEVVELPLTLPGWWGSGS